jgi:hypothetical protein
MDSDYGEICINQKQKSLYLDLELIKGKILLIERSSSAI